MTPVSRAGGATSDALATPQPPSLSGSVACTHAASDAGVPSSQVARWVAVTSAAKAAVWRIGRVRRAYWTFAGPGQDRMTVRANLPFRAPDGRPPAMGREGRGSGSQDLRAPFQMQTRRRRERGRRRHQTLAPHGRLPEVEVEAQRGQI